MKLSRNGFYGVCAFLFFPVILIAGCDLFSASMVDYFLDHNEIVKVTGLAARPGYVISDGGTVLIPPGGTTILGLTLSNPRNLAVRQELLGVPAGKNIVARQTGRTDIEVHIAGAVEGDDYGLTLAMQSPDGLRDFPPYSMRIRCVSFETKLQDFTLDGASVPAFDPARDAFRANVPYSRSTVTLGGTTEHPEAALEFYAGTDDSGQWLAKGTHTLELPQGLELGDNHFYIKITAPSSTVQGYVLTVHRAQASENGIEGFYFALDGKRYGVGAGVESGSGSISGNAITATVPYGTDLTAMTATADHTGESISPDPATARSYAAPVSYTVTAADGTARTYTVQVGVAKIASIEAIDFTDGFAKTGADISGVIKAAITEVTGTDSLGGAVTLAEADYSVDPLVPAVTGTSEAATLRVPAARTSTGADITKTFTVYIKSDAKEITEFYFTLNGKHYGVGTEAESGSGSLSGNAIAVTVPYGTAITAMTATATHTGASISPDPETARSYAGPVTYTVTAADGASQAYTVTVNVAKIASVTAVNGALTSPNGFVKTGSDISGVIKAAITEVTGTDSLGGAVTLAEADYSVDPLAPAVTGTNGTATLRVPAARSSTGADITQTFTVYIKNDAKEITEFYFTLNGKHYGVGTGVEGGSGSLSGNAITITVPHGTNLATLVPTVTHSGTSIDPVLETAWGSLPSPHSYRVTAEDGTYQDYAVTVTVAAPGITISGITVEGLAALTFDSVSSPVDPGATIDITINGIVTVSDWHIEVSGASAPQIHTANTFNAPAAPGFYNVNVIATVGGVPYSGSFGLVVK